MKNIFIHFKKQGTIFSVIFAVSFFLVLPQILNHSLVLGTDSLFHFNRIYDAYMQFKTGNFSYFQSNYGFQQSGRIVNALYGPGFAYFLGGLLLAVHSWIKFQIVTSFLIFFVSGYSMYLLSREMDSTKKISLLTAALFMGSLWITRWSTSQNFMAWGISLMPLIVLMGTKMIKNNSEGLRIIPFALVVSVLIQVHLISALMSVGVLAIFFIVGFLKTNQKVKLLSKCFFAGLLSLVLTFNVWGALLDVFSTNKVYSPFGNLNMSAATMNLSTDNATFTQIGLVMSIIFILQIIWLFIKKDTLTLTNKVVTVLGIIFLVLSSNLLPWTSIGNSFPEIQHLLQFPYRFEGFASVLLLAGFGATVSTLSANDFRKYFELIMTVGSVLMLVQFYLAIQFDNQLWNSEHSVISLHDTYFAKNTSNDQITNAFTGSNLDAGLLLVTKPTSDYLPNNRVLSKSPDADYRKDMISNEKSKVTKIVDHNGDLTLSWNAKKIGDTISLPIVIYTNSSVQLNGTNLNQNKIKLSTMGKPTINSTKNGINYLKIGYHSKIITKSKLTIVILAWIISGLAIIVLPFTTHKKH